MPNISQYNLLDSLPNRRNVDFIDNEIYLCELVKDDDVQYNYPIKTDLTICCICLRGEIVGKIDLLEYRVAAPGMAISTPGQILEPGRYSDDFHGILVYMTRKFTENFNLLLGHSLIINLRNRPYVSLSEKELLSLITYCDMVRNTIRASDNPYRLQTIIHLTAAYFYGIGYFLHKALLDKELTKSEATAERFLKKVRDCFKKERSVEYYAAQLHLSSNYLSHVVKEVTGKTAGQWIDDFVTLEAKALLKSTDMTVQQIADELNFPSQSFFGKYFKRVVGVPPKQYR